MSCGAALHCASGTITKRRSAAVKATKNAFEWGVVRGRVDLPATVVASAAAMAHSYFKEAEASEFSGDPVEEELVPSWMDCREQWLPHEQLHELGFKIDMIEMEQLLLTVGVDSHIDAIHGPVFILVLHNNGMTFKQARISHKTQVGEWFVFDDCKAHAVRESATSTAYVCWSVPLVSLSF